MAAIMLAKGWDGVAPAQAGWLGLVVLLLLGVAVVFLYRSMNKHIKKIPVSFDPPADVHLGAGASLSPDQSDTQPPK
jgi:hypothetical protein